MKSEQTNMIRRVVVRMALTALIGILGIFLCIFFFFKGAYVRTILSAFSGMMLIELVHVLLSDKKRGDDNEVPKSKKEKEKKYEKNY